MILHLSAVRRRQEVPIADYAFVLSLQFLPGKPYIVVFMCTKRNLEVLGLAYLM